MARLLCVLCVVIGLLVGGGVVRGDDGMALRVSGVVRLADGSPAAGATVTLMAHGGSAVAEADGSFVIEARVPRVVAEVSVSALLERDDRQFVGTATGVGVGGGEAEVGVVVMGSLCEPEWSALTGPGGTGVSGGVNGARALAVFDDGTGPALYAGGPFTTAGGVTVNYIARWDGSAWSALTGPGGTGLNGTVLALTVFDDGAGTGPALYAGGEFTTAGGVPVNRIARWDGSAWSALTGPAGTGMHGCIGSSCIPRVWALSVFDDGTGPALYAGGEFTTAGGVPVNFIARWDGSSWSPLTGPGGTGVSGGSVRALTVFDDGTGPALYAGGEFTTAGGVMVNFIARWNGSAWLPLTGPGITGMNGTVSALTVFDDGAGTGPALYAGGEFTTAGGVPVNRIARWDGSAWSALTSPGGIGVNSGVDALTVFDDGTRLALYAGGTFTTAGGMTVNRIARWDGSAWSPLIGPSGTGMDSAVRGLTVFDDGTGAALYAGGPFTTAGGVTVNRIARWGRPCPVPLITSQPKSVLLPAVGGLATLSIVAEGVGLSYQWWRDGMALSDSSNISGSGTPQLIVFSQGPSMTGLYRCVVTDVSGAVVMSDEAIVAARPSCTGDVNFDGVINTDDLGILLGAFGTVCP